MGLSGCMGLAHTRFHDLVDDLEDPGKPGWRQLE